MIITREEQLFDLLENHQKEYFVNNQDNQSSLLQEDLESLNGRNWDLLADRPQDRNMIEMSSIMGDNHVTTDLGMTMNQTINDFMHQQNSHYLKSPLSVFDMVQQQQFNRTSSMLQSSPSSAAHTPPKNGHVHFNDDLLQINRVLPGVGSEFRSTISGSGSRTLSQPPNSFENAVSKELATPVCNVIKSLVLSLPAKRSSKNLHRFFIDLAANDFSMPVKQLVHKFKLFAVEQEDLLNIEELPPFSPNSYYDAFLDILANKNEDQKVVNLDLFLILMKSATVNPLVKEALLSCPVEAAAGSQRPKYQTIVDMMLFETLKVAAADQSFNGFKSQSFGFKHFFYSAIEAMMEFKKAHHSAFPGELVSLLRDQYLQNVKRVQDEVQTAELVLPYLRLLESDRDVEG